MAILRITKKSLRQSYIDLTKQAKLDTDFIILTIASAAICSFGFKMNSSSVIIGAMVISPLLYSVVSIGVASCKADWKNLSRALFTLLVGLITTLITGVIINLFANTNQGSEIIDRLVSSPQDYFFVALFCGLAGTFMYFWPGMLDSVTGVAISVALIPPVILVSIGLANLDYSFIIASGNIVLFSIIGIFLGSFIMYAGLHFLYKNK